MAYNNSLTLNYEKGKCLGLEYGTGRFFLKRR